MDLTNEEKKSGRAGFLRMIGAFVGILALVPAITILVGDIKSAHVQAPWEAMKGQAFVRATDAVRDHLKAPGSADFSPVSETEIEHEDGANFVGGEHFVVSGWVDAQNGFGAKLRHEYVCKLYYLPENKRWLIVSVDLSKDRRF